MIFTNPVLTCVMHHVEGKLMVPKAVYMQVLEHHGSVTLSTQVIKSTGRNLSPIG